MKRMSLPRVIKEPKRGSLERKSSTTHNIIFNIDSRKPTNLVTTQEELEYKDIYMVADEVVGTSTLSVQTSLEGEAIISSLQDVDDDDTNMDGIFLKKSSNAPLEAPALPASSPPSFIKPGKYIFLPLIRSKLFEYLINNDF